MLLKWLGETRYDVVCLQGLKTSDEKFPVEAIKEAGYGAIWHGQKSYNGVAILARGEEPVERRRGLPGDPDDTHSWLPVDRPASRAATKLRDGRLVVRIGETSCTHGKRMKLQSCLGLKNSGAATFLPWRRGTGMPVICCQTGIPAQEQPPPPVRLTIDPERRHETTVSRCSSDTTGCLQQFRPRNGAFHRNRPNASS